MRESRQTNLLILGASLAIAVAFALYAVIALRWMVAPRPLPAKAPVPPAEVSAALAGARRDFRDRLLDPRAHLRLSDALWKAGRPIDAFYVMDTARQVFSDQAFRAAHAEAILGAGGPAAAARARVKGLVDPALTVPIYAETARDYPATPEGRDSLDLLSKMASTPDDSPAGDAGRLARTALEELCGAEPNNPEMLAALAGADLARGEVDAASARAIDAWNKHPGQAGAARVLGMIALKNGDYDRAEQWLRAAWDRNPQDMYSAENLARIEDKRRSDPESALPYYLALYRQNPDYADGEPVESRIREILDRRRESLLKDATVDGLGGRFQLDDASLRAEAAVRAAAFKDSRWIGALGALLDDDTDIVRRDADYALFQIAQADPEAVRAQREQWLHHDSPLVRIRALNLFADLDGKNALPDAVAALHDPNPGVRVYADLMVLGHYFKNIPEAARARARYRAEEKDPAALDFLRRFADRER